MSSPFGAITLRVWPSTQFIYFCCQDEPPTTLNLTQDLSTKSSKVPKLDHNQVKRPYSSPNSPAGSPMSPSGATQSAPVSPTSPVLPYRHYLYEVKLYISCTPKSRSVEKLPKYRILFKDILTFLRIDYRDASLITMYFIVLEISIQKIRAIG